MLPMIRNSLLTVNKKRVGFWVVFAEHCGDSLTHMPFDAVTLKNIYRSALRPRTPTDPNKRLVDGGVEEDHLPHGIPTKHPSPLPNGEKSAQSDTSTVYIKKGMMMFQPQASLCQNSTLMSLLEGPFSTPWRRWGETKGKSQQKSG